MAKNYIDNHEISIPHWFYSNCILFLNSGFYPHFNTTLVLFKLKCCFDTISLHKSISIPHWFYSNFLKVWYFIPLNYDFNTTLVLFKHNLEYLLKDLESKFQYHTGSIQTFKSNARKSLFCLFQYHTGSIQTRT